MQRMLNAGTGDAGGCSGRGEAERQAGHPAIELGAFGIADLAHRIACVVQQVARSLQFFFAAGQFNDVDYILLAGGSSMLAGLDDAVLGRTQISTMIANPFTTMTHSSHVELKNLLLDAPSLLVACGLALRRFD